MCRHVAGLFNNGSTNRDMSLDIHTPATSRRVSKRLNAFVLHQLSQMTRRRWKRVTFA